MHDEAHLLEGGGLGGLARDSSVRQGRAGRPRSQSITSDAWVGIEQQREEARRRRSEKKKKEANRQAQPSFGASWTRGHLSCFVPSDRAPTTRSGVNGPALVRQGEAVDTWTRTRTCDVFFCLLLCSAIRRLWPGGARGGRRETTVGRDATVSRVKGASRQLRDGHAATMCDAVAYSGRERQDQSGKFPRLVHDAGDARQPALLEEEEEAELIPGSRRLAGPRSEAYDRGVRAGLWLGSADCCPTVQRPEIGGGQEKAARMFS